MLDPKEILPIPEYPNYGCDRLGNVYSISKGKKIKPSFDRGYARVGLYLGDRKSKTIAIHRLIASTFIGPANGLCVNHINGIKSDNRIENLEYCTNKENIRHAWDTGLSQVSDKMRAMFRLRRARKVIDTNTGEIFVSLAEVARVRNLHYRRLLSNFKKGYRNKTTLQWLDKYNKVVNMQIQLETKAKIFAQYLGCWIACHGRGKELLTPMSLYQITYGDFKYHDFALFATPLSSITDEDAIECLNLVLGEGWNYNSTEERRWIDLIKNEVRDQFGSVQMVVKPYFSNVLKIFQYLQSKGYALPYLNYSVEDLVQAGIYKLTQ